MSDHKVEVYEGKDGQWYWRRKAANGEIIATGEGYEHKADATASANSNFPTDELVLIVEEEA